MQEWSRGEIIALASLVVSLVVGVPAVLAAWLKVPEFRTIVRVLLREGRARTSTISLTIGGAVVALACCVWALAFFGAGPLAAVSHALRVLLLYGGTGTVVIGSTALGGWIWFQYRPGRDIIVMVTEIQGPDPQRYRVTENILNNLRSELAEIKHLRVTYESRVISTADGSQVARALATKPFGSRNDATIVVWGWYAPTPTHVQVALHVELLREPPGMPRIETGKPRVYPVTLLDSFVLQTQLSENMVYLSAFMGGLLHYTCEEYEAASGSFTIALAQPSQSRTGFGQDVVLYYRGASYFFQSLYHQAIDDFTEAMRVQPDHPDLYFNRGGALAELGEWGRALSRPS